MLDTPPEIRAQPDPPLEMDALLSLPNDPDEEWRQWMRKYAARLLLFARHQGGSATDAEDLLQEALVETWKRKSEEAPPALPLVYATIRRRAVDRARAESRRRRREDAFLKNGEAWFVDNPEVPDVNPHLEAGIRAMPSLQREVLLMKVWGELTFEQIGQVLDIPPATAASRYRYGLECLRQTLKEGHT